MSIGETPGQGCGDAGSSEKICDCLGCALKSIAASTAKIAETLERKLKGPCDQIDLCIDKVIEALKKKIEGPLYSQESCRDMVRRGLAGTLEYAVRCAHKAAEECDTICSAGDPTSEGKCCKECGKEKCVCKQGVCVPVEEKEEKKWQAWCNPKNGMIAVTKQGESPPGPEFTEVGLAGSEAAAVELAKANCQQGEKPIIIPGGSRPEIPSVASGTVGCYLAGLIDGTASSKLNAQAVHANIASGNSQFWESVGRLGFEGLNLANVGQAIFGATRAFLGADPLIANDLMPALSSGLGCNSPQFNEVFKAVASLSQAANYFGLDITPFVQQHLYVLNAECRQKHLSPDQAAAAYLANTISPETLDQYWAIHGLCNESLNRHIGAVKSKPIPLQLATMRRRRMIDAEGYHSGMRRLGYLEPETAEDLFKLTEQVPTMSDIIRFMVRDADDEGLVQQFKLDTGFTEKYGAQLKDWSEFQGISELQAKYSWRSHWSIPSPTALFNFWHRLRYNPKFGGKDKLEQDIRAAMIQQDILPYWHEHYLAVSFRPMRLVDIRRSFQIGSLSDSELVPAYLDLGFSDDAADKMAKFTRELRDRALPSELPVKRWLRLIITRAEAENQLSARGFPGAVIRRGLDELEGEFIKSPYSKAYARGDIDKQDLITGLSQYGVSRQAIDKIAALLSLSRKKHPALMRYSAGLIDRATASTEMLADGMLNSIVSRSLDSIDDQIQIEFLRACVAGIKRRFLMGELTQGKAILELQNQGMDAGRARMTAGNWNCELKSGEKEVSAAKLCEWLQRGAISSAQFLSRLDQIGYSQADAALMLEDCLIALSAQRLAQAKKEAKEQAAEQQRIARALEKQARAVERFARQQQTATEKAARTRQNREKILLSAATELTPKCECDLYSALGIVKSESARLRNSFGLTIDESLQVISLAAKEFSGPALADFPAIVTALGEASVSAALNGQTSAVYIPPSTNGSTVPS